jgi:phosphoglycolate phosphatase
MGLEYLSRVLKLLVFDLDGTLADTRRDLAASVNAALAALGRSALPVDTVVGFVGDGARNLLTRSLTAAGEGQASTATLDAAMEAFLAHYREHCLIETRAYPGLEQALERLSHYRKSVLTNKPVAPAIRILEGLGLAQHFGQVFGGDNPYGQKPDPAALRRLMELAGARPEETLMIGDGVQDLRAARRAGTRFLGYLEGMGPRAALLGGGGAGAEGAEATFAAMAELPAAIAALENGGAAAAAGDRT